MKLHKPYKFSRRSFLSSVGGAAGFVAMLKNVESQAAGATSPARLLVTHHPVGTIHNDWVPSGSGTSFTFSRILQVFEPMRERIIIIDGLDLRQPGTVGGGHEAGTVQMMTGTHTVLTRGGQPEQDDPPADGPSADQLFLSKSAALQEAPIQSLQAICDDRIDAEEVSTRTLSYSLQRQTVQGVNGSGQENIPMRPVLSPLALFQQVFGNFVPGDSTDDAVAKALEAKKSILDYSLRELARLRTLAPSSQWDKLDAHETAIRDVEREITSAVPNGCAAPEPPDASVVGQEDDGRFKGPADYDDPSASTADDELHRQVGEAHLSIIRGALACDLTRVVTFQFSPGTNHVSFKGMRPDDANAIYMHHPVSHKIGGGDIDAPAGSRRWEVEFLINIEMWYNQRILDFLNLMDSTQDVYGGSLLDWTVIPYLTEVARATHEWSPTPTVIFGGQALGFQGGQFINARRNHVDMWLAVAQSLGISMDDLAGEKILSGSYQGPLPVLA